MQFNERAGNELELRGRISCLREVVLEVEKLYETRYVGRSGILQVRCYSYLYVGWVKSGNLALKYHNFHEDREDYIHRIYDPLNGRQILYEILHRHQFPVFSGVLDELEIITRVLNA